MKSSPVLQEQGAPRRSWKIFTIFLFLLLALCAGGGYWGPLGESPLEVTIGAWAGELPAGKFILLFGATWIAGLALLAAYPQRHSMKQDVWVILGLALLLRMLVFPHEHSDDLNRYLWEGRLLSEGINPYRFSPDHPDLQQLAAADPYHRQINHPDLPAAYPPLMLYLFSALARAVYHPMAVKVLMVLFDMGTLVLLLVLLRDRSLDMRWSLLYAVNPVILYAFSGQGHLDAAQNFFLMAALLCYARRSWVYLFVFTGLAVQSKYMAAAAVPFLLNRDNLRQAWILPVVVVLPFLPLAGDGLFFFDSLAVFSRDYAFNGSIHGLLQVLTGDIRSAGVVCKLLFPAVLAVGIAALHPQISERFRKEPAAGCFFALGAVLLLSPTVHFWYLTWIIPFLPLFPSRSWILLCLTSGMVFVSDGFLYQTGSWRYPVWVQVTVWLPFYILLAWEGIVFLRRQRIRESWPAPRTLSVVIPARNEAVGIGACIDAARQGGAVCEVVVVDGASTDQTVKIAESRGAQVLSHTEPPERGGGRGGQIAAGVGIARGDVVAVVHADTILAREDLDGMMAVLQKNPALIGGAVGGVFDETGWRMGLIGFLNDCRMLLSGISFGDQVQFFRRKPVAARNLFPGIPLMEDVEFGIRLHRLGRQTFLFGNTRMSSRRWKRKGLCNSISVVFRVAFYLLKRVKGLPDTTAMYRNYYRNDCSNAGGKR